MLPNTVTILGFCSFALLQMATAVLPELEKVENPSMSGSSLDAQLTASSTVRPFAGWSKADTSTPWFLRTVPRYRMPSGGEEALPLAFSCICPSLSMTLALMKENFKISPAFPFHITSPYLFWERVQPIMVRGFFIFRISHWINLPEG